MEKTLYDPGAVSFPRARHVWETRRIAPGSFITYKACKSAVPVTG